MANVAHAAGESSPGDLKAGTFAIVLAANNATKLDEVATRLTISGLKFVSVNEPDAPWNNSRMAIGVVPVMRSSVKCLSDLPLWKGSTCAK